MHGKRVDGLVFLCINQNAATLSSISGEWNIIEVNGTAVVPAPGQEFPYIGFDTKTGKVFWQQWLQPYDGFV